MSLLIIYIAVALVVSFVCSVSEAVILSITPSYTGLLQQGGKVKLARSLSRLKEDINQPLSAILTLNTIAHTVGAAGAGAQATKVFGDTSLGIFSGLLTLAILVFSEIIPKTLGAHYWRELTPMTVWFLELIVKLLYPFVKLSTLLTSKIAGTPSLKGFNRQELAAMAELSSDEGQIEYRERLVIKNLLEFQYVKIKQIVTPRIVVFSVDVSLTVGQYFEKHSGQQFSRIPVYKTGPEDIVGFVLRSELLTKFVEGKADQKLESCLRPIHAVPESLRLSALLDAFLVAHHQIAIVVDEHGGFEGIITLEDILERLIGQDIVDESDKVPNMRSFALSLFKQKKLFNKMNH